MEQDNLEKKKTEPKDIFIHLLAIITLYVSAISFTTLIFQYVNIYFPDLLQGDYYRPAAFSKIRWAISSLIIVFPVYLLTSRFLNKSYNDNPSKRNLRIRKWLIYFTLFAAALIIIGDLVALINNLLGGELTVRFLLKVLTILFVAGSIFFYYFSDLRRYKVD
jgi:uncharacterized membrane protein